MSVNQRLVHILSANHKPRHILSANQRPGYLHSEADEARREAGPEPLLRDLVTAVDLEAVEALEELHEGLQSSVRHVTTP